jgi:hypothetical protein
MTSRRISTIVPRNVVFDVNVSREAAKKLVEKIIY